MQLTANDRAVLAHVANRIELVGFARSPHAGGSPSLGRLVCGGWHAIREQHENERCRALQNAIARFAGEHDLQAVVATLTDAEIVAHLRNVASLPEVVAV